MYSRTLNAHRAFAVGAIAALGLSACGGEADEPGEEASDEQVTVGEEFNIAWNAQPPSLDPTATTSTATRDIARNFFEPLITLNRDGEVETVLAEDYEVSDDGLEITFTLREGVLFHNGDEMTAEDVVASLERWFSLSNRGQLFFSEAQAETREEGQVTVILPHAMYIAVELMVDHQVMPASLAEESPDMAVEEIVGTGPYEFVEWAPDQYVHLQRFEDYQSPEGEPSGTAGSREAGFENLYYYIVTDSSTRVAGVQSGEYDAANAIPLDNVDMLENDDTLVVESGEQGFTGPVFNKQEGVMSDILMRQAVLAAMDPEALQRSAFVSEEFYNTNGALMPEESPWYSDVGQELFLNDDPAVVEDLLDEAGYDGETIRILTTREYDDHYNMAVILQQQMQDHGMNVELNVVDWPTVLEQRDDPSSYEIFMTGFAPPTTPVIYVFLEDAWPGWTDSEEIDAAVDSIVTAESEEGALEGAEELQQAYFDYLPVVKPGEKWTVTALRDGFEGYEYAPLSGDIFYNVHATE